MTGRPDVMSAVSGLAELAEAQSDVCLRSQLTQLGVGCEAVGYHVGARRWRLLGPLLVVLHRGPLLTAGRRWAVVLNAGSGAALGAWTALDAWGLSGWQRDATHIVVARGAQPPPLPVDVVGPVVVHESRRHGEQDVRTKDGLRLHGVERSAVDAGAWSRTDRSACGILAATVQQRLTTADRLAGELDGVGQVRRRRLMTSVVADIGGGAQALSEIDFVRFCRRRGLPEPARQVLRLDATGRRRYLDVEWQLPGGGTVAVEIDGVGHMDASRWYDDLLRTAELLAGGSSDPVRLPAMAVRLEPDRVERILRALLGLVRR